MARGSEEEHQGVAPRWSCSNHEDRLPPSTAIGRHAALALKWQQFVDICDETVVRDTCDLNPWRETTQREGFAHAKGEHHAKEPAE